MTATEEITKWVIEFGSERDALNVALARLAAAEARDTESEAMLADYQAIISLQRTRTATVDRKWQMAHNEPKMWPDLGELIEWLDKRAEVAEANLAVMTDKAGDEFERAEAAEARAAQLASCLSNLGQDAHMGDCWAALHDFASGFECDCGVSTALSISDVQITETEHPLKTAARLSRPKSK